MNKELFDYIEKLSIEDRKGLLGKALKTTEEVGELAKVILPYEDQAGTFHRFTDKEKILEGVADVMLSAISIAYQLGYDHQAIADMLWRKSRKWADIQNVEGQTKFPIPFEIHVTVKMLFNTVMVEDFKEICKSIGVKPIVIELEKGSEVVMQDVMTSSTHVGTNRSAYEESERIRWHLMNVGMLVERVKIETVPWHPMAPKTVKDVMPQDCYFESHLRIVTTQNRKWILEKIAEEFGAHLSRNYFKKLNDDEYIIMMTLRHDEIWRSDFEKKVDELKKILKKRDFEVDKTEIEFAVYDSKVHHDAIWLK